MTRVLDVPLNGPPAARVPVVLEHRCALSGLALHALPPGNIEVGFRTETYLLDINLDAGEFEIAGQL